MPKLCVLAACAALVFAGTAKANSISLIWQGSGTAVATAAPSATITADIVLTVTASNVNFIAWNLGWDDELAYVTSTTTAANGWTDVSDLNAAGASTGTSPGSQRIYNMWAGAPTQNMNRGTATVGTITFHVTAAVSADGAPGTAVGRGAPTGDVSADFVNTAGGTGCFITKGGYCTGSVTVLGASVDVVPEPGTLGLLALGLAGLGFGRPRTISRRGASPDAVVPGRRRPIRAEPPYPAPGPVVPR